MIKNKKDYLYYLEADRISPGREKADCAHNINFLKFINMKLNKKNRVILFIISSPLFASGGHSKNFMNLIKFIGPSLEKAGYKLLIASFNHKPEDVTYDTEKIAQTPYLEGTQILLLKRKFPSGKTIYQLLEYVNNLFNIFKVALKYKPSIVYAYGDKALYLSSMCKLIFGYKLIGDIRGDAISESKQRGYNLKKIMLMKKIKYWSESRADKIFEVYYLGETNSNKYLAKYNFFDGNYFYYDKDKSKLKKKELGLLNKFVFVYSGGTQYYQMIETMILFYNKFLEKFNDTHFIIITEFEKNEFVKYFKKHNIASDYYSIYNLDHKKVNDLQTIGDIALLFREDIPLNHHAFPTKFAEYLASGVPVLTTPYLHTIAPLITDNNLGEVIDIFSKNINYNNLINLIHDKYKNNYEIKNRCANFARVELMWQNKSKEIYKVINNL